MKKRIITISLVIALLATCFAGTYAYLTDEEVVHNTMTLGDVEINIEELSMDANGVMKKFENDAFMLYPIDETVNAVDYNKMVYTYNTSKSKDPVYIRNLVAFEDPMGIGYSEGLLFYHDGYSSAEIIENVTINGQNYYVAVFVQRDGKAIEYGKYLPTVNGVWMHKNVTNEKMALYGDKIDILVFSQAIQSVGLTHEAAMAALGVLTAESVGKLFESAENGTINDWLENYR